MTTPELVTGLREMASQILSPQSAGKRFFEEAADRLERLERAKEEQVVQDFYNSGNHALQADAMTREIVKLRQLRDELTANLNESREESRRHAARIVELLGQKGV